MAQLLAFLRGPTPKLYVDLHGERVAGFWLGEMGIPFMDADAPLLLEDLPRINAVPRTPQPERPKYPPSTNDHQTS